MLLFVDLSQFIYDIFGKLIQLLASFLAQLDEIYIFDGTLWGVDIGIVSLLDFNIGLLVTAIVIGAFVRISKADTFYSNKKD